MVFYNSFYERPNSTQIVLIHFFYVLDNFGFVVFQLKSPHKRNVRSEKYYKPIFSQRPYFGLYSELKEKAVIMGRLKCGVGMPVAKLTTPTRGNDRSSTLVSSYHAQISFSRSRSELSVSLVNWKSSLVNPTYHM
jgi:hypothetical protein